MDRTNYSKVIYRLGKVCNLTNRTEANWGKANDVNSGEYPIFFVLFYS